MDSRKGIEEPSKLDVNSAGDARGVKELEFETPCNRIFFKSKKSGNLDEECIKGESNPRRVDGNDPGYHYPINATMPIAKCN